MSKIGTVNLAGTQDDMDNAPDVWDLIDEPQVSALESELELAQRQVELEKYTTEELEAEIDRRAPKKHYKPIGGLFDDSIDTLNGLHI